MGLGRWAIMRRLKEISETVIKSRTTTNLILLAVLIAVLAGCQSNGRKKLNARSGVTAAELYDEAKFQLDYQNYERASQPFRLLQSRFPFGKHTEQAMLELAYALYKSYKPDEAIAQLDKYLKTYPTHANADYAHYLKGLVNFSRTRGFLARLSPERAIDRDQTFARQSFDDFSQLIRNYPDSRYAHDARQRMLFLRDNMAAHEIMVADYYMRRRAYVAAANRAKHVLEVYQESPVAADALAVMVDAYREMGLSENSEDALAVLKLNYPDHGYLTGNYNRGSVWSRLWPFD